MRVCGFVWPLINILVMHGYIFMLGGLGGVICKMRELVAFVLTYSLTGYVHCSVTGGLGYRRARLAPRPPILKAPKISNPFM